VICFDTNAVIVALNDRTSVLRSRIDAVVAAGESLALSAIVLYELRYGAAKSTNRARNIRRIDDFLAGPFLVLQVDADDACEAGDIRAALEAAGTPIGPYDVLIAAQARRRNALLVTANVREFARVPGLTWEDWTATTPSSPLD
jgi:tRNA(fMet)-specific endonuclease VapC